MSNKFYLPFKPLSCKEVEKVLLMLGFQEDKGKGTSHRQFRLLKDGHLYKTTLDCHKGQVKALNIRSMIKQMGVSKKEFYEALNK